MGKSRAGGIPGTRGATPAPSFSGNLPSLESEFPMTPGGWFGEKSSKKNSDARIIKSQDPLATAEHFFDLASNGGKMHVDTPKIKIVKFYDGSRVGFRPVSTSDGSPAVEIWLESPSRCKDQKIHFERN